MAIHQEQIQEIQGFDKEIEQSAMGMILDNLQQYQYQYPQKSTVRELVSNALDAIRERHIALSILSGQAKVEDHFITRQEALYKDSNFDPSYYDTKWLTNHSPLIDPNKVYVTYVDGGDREKDKLLIEDHGVGMGGKRLEGYFKLGFSTKRNTKSALGKFGIGAKAALATASSYIMTTRYNGEEYKFQVYSHRISSVVPELNLETGERNKCRTLSNGAVVYYRTTDKPNGTSIEVECKKHHRQLYIDAVKSQLLYFDNVEFRIRNSSGGTDIIPVKADILYEDDHVILSDNTQYSKPHMLINKVNYGNIDFRELELEDMQGNIGIKVDAEEVTVNPSRESLIWNEHTRETVVRSFKKVVDIAGGMIGEQLQERDFLKWVVACSQVSGRWSGSSTILGRLSNIVDISSAKVKYSQDPEIIYNYDLFKGIKIRTNRLSVKREGSVEKYTVERERTTMTDLASGMSMFIKVSPTSFARDKYMLKTTHPEGFITIEVPFKTGEFQVGEEEAVGEIANDTEATTEQEFFFASKAFVRETAKANKMSVKELTEYVKKISVHINNSTEGIPYDSVIVPEDFDARDTVDTETSEAKKSREARQALTEGQFPIFTLRVSDQRGKTYEWQKLAVSVSTVDSWDNEEIFYASDKPVGTEKVQDRIPLESDLLHLAGMLTRPEGGMGRYHSLHARRNNDPKFAAQQDAARNHGVTANEGGKCTHYFEVGDYKPKVKLVKVAQDRVQYFLDFKHIHRFFLDIKNKTLTMSNALIRWNTARLINDKIGELEFLTNFEMFHGKYARWYEELDEYRDQYFRDINVSARVGIQSDTVSSLVSHCDKVLTFQLICRENRDHPEVIAEAAQEMFNPQQTITDGHAVDIKFYDMLHELLDWARPVKVLLNEMGVLTEEITEIGAELEHEIRNYMTYKDVPMS